MGLLAISPAAMVSGFGQGRGRGRGKEKQEDPSDNDRGEGGHGAYFRREDYATVQRYYSGPRNLPPGLRKKYYRTGTLPPGWQSKIQPFPAELVRVLPPPPPNCDRGYIDGVAVVYDRRTRVIVDAIDLIAAATGH